MENGTKDGSGNDIDVIDLQLQAIWMELKSGIGNVIEDLSTLRQSYSRLEEKFSNHQQETNDKILSLRNTLNTMQEDLNSALVQLSEVKNSSKDPQKDPELQQNTQQRKGSRGDGALDGHTSLSSQPELSLVQHYINSILARKSSYSEHDGPIKPSMWRERKNSRDLKDYINPTITQRQTAALELLESERVYVSYLSLLLKANITFNSSENVNFKDKRPFPPSLRFLIQQHMELLHLLQERILKSDWQGIMGDVFLRLSSKESDFLDHYISYLRELPDCLNVVSLLSSSKSGNFLESEITGDETHSSLSSLLLQPVQRIPEYHTLLQSLLQQTESEHPDYYLLLVSVQQLRYFMTQYSHLLQHNQDLLTHSHVLCSHQQERVPHPRKELSRSTVRQLYKVDYENNYNSSVAQNDPPRRIKRYPDYEAAPYHYDPESPSPVSFLSDKSAAVPLRSIPESDRAKPTLADARGGAFSYGGGDSRCSSPSHSSDSSIDIAFVRCNPSTSPPLPPHGRGRNGGGVVYRPNRVCVSPDSSDIMRPRPLQEVHRKSKSLNGLQLEGIDSHAPQGKPPAHPKLERQSSGKTRLRSGSPKSRYEPSADTEGQPLSIYQKDSRGLMWEDLKLRGVSDDYEHTPLSDVSRKEAKGFRNSFKKLFKKKSSGDGKDKTVKGEQITGDLESSRIIHPGDIDRGTAV